MESLLSPLWSVAHASVYRWNRCLACCKHPPGALQEPSPKGKTTCQRTCLRSGPGSTAYAYLSRDRGHAHTCPFIRNFDDWPFPSGGPAAPCHLWGPGRGADAVVASLPSRKRSICRECACTNARVHVHLVASALAFGGALFMRNCRCVLPLACCVRVCLCVL